MRIPDIKLTTALDIFTGWTAFLKSQVSRRNLSDSVFTMNEHCLLHLHRVLRHLGPLPVYAAFAMERAIGEIKGHINSKRNPGKNASNVMVDLAAGRYRTKRMQENNDDAEDQAQKNVITITGSDVGSPELWGPHIRWINLNTNPQAKLAIRDYWRWCRGEQHLTTPNGDIQQASRMGRMGNFDIPLVFTSALRKEKTAFVRCIIPVDVDQSSDPAKLQVEPRAYIGQVKFYRKHVYNDQEVLLALVEVCSTAVIGGVPWPYGTNRRKAWKAIPLHCIVSDVGVSQASGGRHFFFWSSSNNRAEDSAVDIDHSLQYI
ncbi:predicted protein [Lichtheimia corymbifera JMRC:FSU:9682]|uniref:Uncharacterized protein n=1 Tax=Lichtheimia corymbifera JMRC:FSU:9682 TaxID=1263082 RepID=A0A068SHR2_9FUNG|nr:predicted protein [Lichtheimia corymbifera JMRC:FSU:9682]